MQTAYMGDHGLPDHLFETVLSVDRMYEALREMMERLGITGINNRLIPASIRHGVHFAVRLYTNGVLDRLEIHYQATTVWLFADGYGQFAFEGNDQKRTAFMKPNALLARWKTTNSHLDVIVRKALCGT